MAFWLLLVNPRIQQILFRNFPQKKKDQLMSSKHFPLIPAALCHFSFLCLLEMSSTVLIEMRPLVEVWGTDLFRENRPVRPSVRPSVSPSVSVSVNWRKYEIWLKELKNNLNIHSWLTEPVDYFSVFFYLFTLHVYFGSYVQIHTWDHLVVCYSHAGRNP